MEKTEHYFTISLLSHRVPQPSAISLSISLATIPEKNMNPNPFTISIAHSMPPTSHCNRDCGLPHYRKSLSNSHRTKISLLSRIIVCMFLILGLNTNFSRLFSGF